MEKNFDNSVLNELKLFKGFVFTPLRLYEIFYNEESERRTLKVKTILEYQVMKNFLREAKFYGNGFRQPNAFKDILSLDVERKLRFSKIKESFSDIIKNFKKRYNEKQPYDSYVYATIIVSIILAMPGYFEEETIYEFVHFCRKNFILNI